MTPTQRPNRTSEDRRRRMTLQLVGGVISGITRAVATWLIDSLLRGC